MKDVSNFMLHPMLWPAGSGDPAVPPNFRGNSENSKIFKNFYFFTETSLWKKRGTMVHVSSVTSKRRSFRPEENCDASGIHPTSDHWYRFWPFHFLVFQPSRIDCISNMELFALTFSTSWSVLQTPQKEMKRTFFYIRLFLALMADVTDSTWWHMRIFFNNLPKKTRRY